MSEPMNPPSRRDVLRLSAATMSAVTLAALPVLDAFGAGSGFFARNKLPIGLQLYTVGDLAKKDLDGTLKRIADIGYDTIELAGLHGHTVAELRAAADNVGLKLVSMHVSADQRPGELSLSGDLKALAASAHQLGVTDIVMPMFSTPSRLGSPATGEGFLAYLNRVVPQFTADDWKRTAAQLNGYGKALHKEGLNFGYHNHNPEFAPLSDGSNGFEILVRETDPKVVSFELDIGWAAAAGQDAIQIMSQHKGRITQLHVKDIKASTKTNYTLQQDPTEVGSGTLDWPSLLSTAKTTKIKRFFVEQEPPFPGDRFDSIAKSYRYLRSL
ncbi:MAG: sugar phosphate isomerase/epimerase [Pseudomonadota bacterium]